MRKLLLLIWIPLLVCFTSLICKGQSYYFKHFETDDGLVNNSVSTITQDRKGFIWIGTRGGLTRFDGYVFKTFNNRNSIWNNHITTIAEDKAGMLWIGTDKGIFKYNPFSETFTRLEIAPRYYINGFVIDEFNNIWLLAQSRLFYFNQQTNKVEDLKIHVSRIAKNFDGNLLLGNYDGMLFTCNVKTKVITQRRVIDKHISSNMRAITKIYPITNDITFLGYKQGLIIYNTKTKESKQIPLGGNDENGPFVRDICLSKDNEYWIATESGLYIYSLATNTWIRLQKKLGDPYAISDNSVYSVYKDQAGDMWVGTFFGGINYHSKKNARFEKYYPIPLKNTISGKAVSEILSDKGRNLYIGTEDAGLNRLDLKTKKIINYAIGQKKGSAFFSNIHSLDVLGNQLFIGSYFHGMQIMNTKTRVVTDVFKIINAPGENGSDFVLSTCITKDSTLYVGTTGDYGGLYRYHPKSKTFSRFKGMPYGTTIYHIAQDSQGKIWAGQKSQTAFFINPKTGRSGSLTFGNQKDESPIHYIMEDSEHALWFSTIGGGLVRLSPDRKSFKKYTTKNGLPSDVLFGILEDSNKQLWIGSNKGLICFDLRTKKIKVYTQDNGLITNQFNFNSACKDVDGKMYFGSVNGLIAFDPNDLNQKEVSPQTYFTGFQINNNEVGPGDDHSPLKKSISFTDTIVLQPHQNSFSIEFAALNFASPKATRYQYKMKGLDRSWTYLNTNRKAYFTDLSPGRYTFTVKAHSNVGTWMGGERKLYIRVLPPIWKSMEAYMFYVIVLILVLYFSTRYYHRYQQKRHNAKLKLFEHQKEREIYQAKIEFFTNIAHEIQTPLTLISVPVERVLNKSEDYPSIKKSLLMIGKYTNRLIDLTSQLLDFRQTEMEQFGLNFVNININQLLNDQLDAFRDLAAENKITLKASLPETDVIAFVDREALNKICSNLISNAIKYAENKVFVQLMLPSNQQNSFSIAFCNDGREIPDKYKEKIFEPFFRLRANEKPGTGIGLSLAKSLAELHNGTLQLTSSEADNIVFMLTLPLHQQFEFNLGAWKKIK